tara:strand:+ start:2354 stop:3760 length:1407 start_codon:yes stop_codon:yes gene_type:complete
MAAEETRDVVIRLAIKQIAQKVTVDTSQAERSISRYQAAISKAVSSATREFEKLRIAGFESMAAIEMEGTDAAGAVGKVGGSAEAAASQASAPLQEIAVELEVLAASAEQVSAGLQKMEMSAQAIKRVEKMSVSAAVGLQRAAGGALQLVRASALLGFSADDDLHRFLRQLARIQGAMDLLSGGLSVYRGLTTAIEKMAMAHKASAAAAAGAAAANARLQVSMAGLLPGTAALAAGGAAFVAIFAFYTMWRDKAREAREEAEKSTQAIESAGRAFERRETDLLRKQRALKAPAVAIGMAEQRFTELRRETSDIEERERVMASATDRMEALEVYPAIKRDGPLATYQREMMQDDERARLKANIRATGEERKKLLDEENEKLIEQEMLLREVLNRTQELAQAEIQKVRDARPSRAETDAENKKIRELEAALDTRRQDLTRLLDIVVQDQSETSKRIRAAQEDMAFMGSQE